MRTAGRRLLEGQKKLYLNSCVCFSVGKKYLRELFSARTLALCKCCQHIPVSKPADISCPRTWWDFGHFIHSSSNRCLCQGCLTRTSPWVNTGAYLRKMCCKSVVSELDSTIVMGITYLSLRSEQVRNLSPRLSGVFTILDTLCCKCTPGIRKCHSHCCLGLHQQHLHEGAQQDMTCKAFSLEMANLALLPRTIWNPGPFSAELHCSCEVPTCPGTWSCLFPGTRTLHLPRLNYLLKLFHSRFCTTGWIVRHVYANSSELNGPGCCYSGSLSKLFLP